MQSAQFSGRRQRKFKFFDCCKIRFILTENKVVQNYQLLTNNFTFKQFEFCPCHAFSLPDVLLAVIVSGDTMTARKHPTNLSKVCVLSICEKREHSQDTSMSFVSDSCCQTQGAIGICVFHGRHSSFPVPSGCHFSVVDKLRVRGP